MMSCVEGSEISEHEIKFKLLNCSNAPHRDDFLIAEIPKEIFRFESVFQNTSLSRMYNCTNVSDRFYNGPNYTQSSKLFSGRKSCLGKGCSSTSEFHLNIQKMPTTFICKADGSMVVELIRNVCKNGECKYVFNLKDPSQLMDLVKEPGVHSVDIVVEKNGENCFDTMVMNLLSKFAKNIRNVNAIFDEIVPASFPLFLRRLKRLNILRVQHRQNEIIDLNKWTSGLKRIQILELHYPDELGIGYKIDANAFRSLAVGRSQNGEFSQFLQLSAYRTQFDLSAAQFNQYIRFAVSNADIIGYTSEEDFSKTVEKGYSAYNSRTIFRFRATPNLFRKIADDFRKLVKCNEENLIYEHQCEQAPDSLWMGHNGHILFMDRL
ncbi:unnamed protein product [Caenorhabditis angaria]|uniref:Uncharacterized protein n=1 Tax=Caenorhabditis angaria TaxID=860376 RepID=A0A9P1IVX5_9PELO|nr:unnamed protein product [Caenorhabditis angaria]